MYYEFTSSNTYIKVYPQELVWLSTLLKKVCSFVYSSVVHSTVFVTPTKLELDVGMLL